MKGKHIGEWVTVGLYMLSENTEQNAKSSSASSQGRVLRHKRQDHLFHDVLDASRFSLCK